MLTRLGLNPSPLGLGLGLGLYYCMRVFMSQKPSLSSTTMGLGFGL